jgi:ankyrin repeat protein
MREVDRFLLDCANAGHAEGIREALAAGANPDSVGRGGRSAAMRSAFRGDQTSLSLLLAAGADPKAKDDWGRTCLMYAAFGQGSCYRCLLDHGADPLAWDDAGESALAYAAAAQFMPMLSALLALGARAAEIQAIWADAQAHGREEVARAVASWSGWNQKA